MRSEGEMIFEFSKNFGSPEKKLRFSAAPLLRFFSNFLRFFVKKK